MKKLSQKFLQNSSLNDEFSTINNKILNYAILISALFSLPGLIGMYFRAKTIMLEPIILFQFALWVFFLLLYLFRNKANFKFKICCYIMLDMALMYSYAFSVGALGYWVLNITLISLIISIFYKREYAFTMLLLLTSSFILIGYFYFTKRISYGFDVLKFKFRCSYIADNQNK